MLLYTLQYSVLLWIGLYLISTTPPCGVSWSSSGVVSSRVWVRILDITRVPSNKALTFQTIHTNHVPKVDDTYAYILTDCEGG